MKLVITANGLQKPEMKPVIDKAWEYFDEVVINPWGRRGTPDEIRQIWNNADAILCGAEVFDQPMLKDAPDTLKVISRFGVGVDNIDISFAKQRGIMVCNTPGANADSVADMTLSLILAVARQTVNHDIHTRLGEWKRFSSMELKGKILGIVGFGAVGQGVARRAKGFGMKIIAYDPYLNAKAAEEIGVEGIGLDELLSVSDFISLHLPCSKELYHVIDKSAFEKMKSSAVFINTARGQLVDESALYDALKSHRIFGAGLDVYSQEPLKESPLFALDNITLMPHCSANTTEAARNMGMMAVENAHRAICGLEGAHILQ